MCAATVELGTFGDLSDVGRERHTHALPVRLARLHEWHGAGHDKRASRDIRGPRLRRAATPDTPQTARHSLAMSAARMAA
ncbi:hypothetical protein rosag_27350 [Roseisolibacter agri]|uniref:Uncharacterized protein n=1 Tax=Roseisolibacter agri TaxID=2014610 RepID=A0AA37Q9K6_9BACT|nr:hypothetical protein rosag_27350 [Roseisolibacter agri]